MITTDQLGRPVELRKPPQRIISLVPSQTELLHDLGLGERVVGITKFCVHPEEWFRSKPRVGGTKKVDIETVRALKPDLVIGNKEENERSDIESLAQEFPVWMSDVRDLNGALDMIERIGSLTGTSREATRMVADIREAFRSIVALDPPLSVAYFIWREPYMLAGADTFVNDMLQHCGFLNVAHGNDRYPVVNAQQLASLDPDVILLSSEPYPFQEKHLAELNMICPGTPVRLVDGEAFSWYGSRLLHAPAYMNGLLKGLRV